MQKGNLNYDEQIKLLEQLNDSNFELDQVQLYLKNILKIRQLDGNTTLEEMLMLIEEVGELAKAIRKYKLNMPIDKMKNFKEGNIEEEIADVFIILVGLCNKLNISLKDCFINKEKENAKRSWSKIQMENKEVGIV